MRYICENDNDETEEVITQDDEDTANQEGTSFEEPAIEAYEDVDDEESEGAESDQDAATGNRRSSRKNKGQYVERLEMAFGGKS